VPIDETGSFLDWSVRLHELVSLRSVPAPPSHNLGVPAPRGLIDTGVRFAEGPDQGVRQMYQDLFGVVCIPRERKGGRVWCEFYTANEQAPFESGDQIRWGFGRAKLVVPASAFFLRRDGVWQSTIELDQDPAALVFGCTRDCCLLTLTGAGKSARISSATPTLDLLKTLPVPGPSATWLVSARHALADRLRMTESSLHRVLSTDPYRLVTSRPLAVSASLFCCRIRDVAQ
jgi:hypothetical protein